ncbi:response regulator transcription factor [Chengkuizengella axinellae]|uniref:Response regulator transcription factor n=1 Tax=Chengkuizengella axinellae TaxID=3064388 RepID=A0ABT9J5B2_9BACL|nr:response regulator transcription factor [Chengkuizengella sp. 2205SS18-9]MDP5276789.1 response regulator transcription factor [Chengkuizengella sp. 2205SS18-9]
MKDKNVLIVDDEQDMRNLIQMYLDTSNFGTFHAANGKEAFFILETERIDIIILDVMMPEMDGFSFCMKVREKSNIPLIFLTARGEEWDRVHGLKLGADDYIVKPFSPGELVARIDAVLRRYNHEIKTEMELYLQIGPLEIDEKGRKVKIHNKPVSLTLKEFDLLLFLSKHKGQALSRQQLLESVWGYDFLGGERTVDTHVKTLRIKMGSFGESIQTVWGIGYKLEV